MGMGPFWRCIAMTRNALIDLEPCKTADKDSVRTEPWHDLHERVVRCKERAAETRTQLGERLGIGSPHADIDLFGTESEVEQHRGAILRPQRLVVWSTLGQHRAAVHGAAGGGQTHRQHVTPALARMPWLLVSTGTELLGRANAQRPPRGDDLERRTRVDASRFIAGAVKFGDRPIRAEAPARCGISDIGAQHCVKVHCLIGACLLVGLRVLFHHGLLPPSRSRALSIIATVAASFAVATGRPQPCPTSPRVPWWPAPPPPPAHEVWPRRPRSLPGRSAHWCQSRNRPQR